MAHPPHLKGRKQILEADKEKDNIICRRRPKYVGLQASVGLFLRFGLRFNNLKTGTMTVTDSEYSNIAPTTSSSYTHHTTSLAPSGSIKASNANAIKSSSTSTSPLATPFTSSQRTLYPSTYLYSSLIFNTSLCHTDSNSTNGCD